MVACGAFIDYFMREFAMSFSIMNNCECHHIIYSKD